MHIEKAPSTRRIKSVTLMMWAMCVTISAQTTWTGAGGDRDWATAGNWNGGLAPATGADVLFSLGDSQNVSPSLINSDLSLTSLRFAPTANGQTIQHTVEIADGATLLITGATALDVGSTTLYESTVTHAIFQGAGTLHINNAAGVIDIDNPRVANGNEATENKATLDLRNLASFIASTGTINISARHRSAGTLYLSNLSNVITANAINVGNSGGSQNPGSSALLSLGAGTNDLTVGTLYIGGGKHANAVMNFGSAAGSLELMATNINVGMAEIGTGGKIIGTLDLRDHDVNVQTTNLTIGKRIGNTGSSGNIGAEGTVWFNQGEMRVSQLAIGHRQGAAIQGAEGFLNVGGGLFVVEEGGSFTLASNTATDQAGIARGTLNITGGVFESHVDIVDGGGNSTSIINLNGGTLDMQGHNIGDGMNAIDTLNFSSGILMNVEEINGGMTGLVKSGVGTLILAGSSGYTGGTMVNAGTLQIGNGGDDGMLGQGNVTLAGTLAFNRHGTLVVDQAITGFSGTIIQDGPGNLILAGDNSALFLAKIYANQGILTATASNSLGLSSELHVGANGEFLYYSASSLPQTLEVFSVSLANGSRLGFGLGNTLHVTSAFTATGTVTVGVFGTGTAPAAGNYELVSSSGGGLDGADYQLLLHNATDYQITSFHTSDTSLSIDVIGAASLTEAYWLGGQVDDYENVWSVAGWDGSNQTSNWASDVTGTVSAVVPGSGTDVFIGANGAVQQNNMTLGADLTIRSLTLLSAGPTLLQNDPLYKLTLAGDLDGRVITMNAGAGATELATRMALGGAAPVITNNSANLLTLSGALEGNGFIKEGSGTTRLSGSEANELQSEVIVEEGVLELGKDEGVDAVNNGLSISAAGTVKLLNSHQIADVSDLHVEAGGAFDLNGFNDTVGALTGDGLVTNLAAGTTSVFGLSGGSEPAGATFSGLLQDGGVDAILALLKTGGGLQILSNSGNNYSGGTTVEDGILRMAASGVLGVGSLTMAGPAAILDMNGFSHTASGVTVDGGIIMGAGSVLTSESTFQMRAGEVYVALAGSSGLTKNTDGLVLLAGDNTYTGNTNVGGSGILRLAHDNALGATGAGNQTTVFGDSSNGVTLELSNDITVSEALTIGARQGATEGTASLRNFSGNNTWAGDITFTTGGGLYNIESAAGFMTISGQISSGTLTGTRIMRLYGDSDGEVSGNIVGIMGLRKDGLGTWALSGNNTFTGVTEINQGTLKLESDLTTSSRLLFGSTSTTTTAGTLDLTEASATFATTQSMLVQTNSATETSRVLIGDGQSLTVNGSVQVGSAATANTNTLFEVSGEGVFNVNGTNFIVGGYTGTTASAGNYARADFSALAQMNLMLNADTGILRVANQSGVNFSNKYAELLLARDTFIRANSLEVGSGGQYNGSSGQVNKLLMGTGETVMHVNSINIGTGSRDFGAMGFQDVNGSLVVRAADGVGRATFNMGTGNANTGVGTADNGNLFDVRGHEADLLLGNVNITTQPRAHIATSSFYFDQGVLDMSTLTMAVRGINNTLNGSGTPRESYGLMDIGGGHVIIQDGILALARVTGTSPATTGNDYGRTRIANATLNIHGNAVVDIHAAGNGVAVSMAGAEQGASAAGNSEAHATINILDQVLVTVHGDMIKEGGPGTTTATLNLEGGTLDMTGHDIGGAVNQVVFNAKAGTLRNLNQLNGGGDLIKSTAGTLSLEGINDYTGRTIVQEGLVRVTHTDNMRSSSGLTVESGAAFHFARTAAGHDLRLASLELQNGSTIGVSVGNLIDVQGLASATGTITMDFFGVSGFTPTGSQITVIEADAGSSLNGASYERGNYYNLTNFTVDSISSTATEVILNITQQGPLTEAWWKGGYGGGLGNVWAITNGTDLSNWTQDEAGQLNTPLVPGLTTKVYFSADGAQNQGSMSLGANMGIGSLEFQDDQSVILLQDMDHELRLNSQDAITVSAGSQDVKLVTNLMLNHSAPEIDVAAGELLEIGGILGGNAATKLGDGVLLLSGHLANAYTGIFKVQGGELQLGKLPGVNAITGTLEVGVASGPGTVRVRLLANDQIDDGAIVDLQSNGVLTLNSFNETIGGLDGDGAVENLASGTTSVLTVGGEDVSSTFNGIIRNGGAEPTLELVKTGGGTFTLGGTEHNTHSGNTSVFGGILQLNKLDGMDAIRANLIVGNGLDAAVVRWLASNQLKDSESNITVNTAAILDLNGFNEGVRSVVLNGGQIQGSTSVLTATEDFDVRAGEVQAKLGGDVDLVKTTGGEVVLSGQSIYTGETRVAEGSLRVAVENALPMGTDVFMGSGDGSTSAGLDIQASQTINALEVDLGSAHSIQIANGQALTQTGGFYFGSDTDSGTAGLTVSGDGAWIVDAPSEDFLVRNATGGNSTFDLNMSGLATFVANVDEFNLGVAGSTAQPITHVKLAASNTITASVVRAGAAVGTGTLTGSYLEFGEQNIIHADTILFGSGRTTIDVRFQSGLAVTPHLTIRDRSGSGRADLVLGSNANSSIYRSIQDGSSSPNGQVDLRGGNVDFLLDDFVIGLSQISDPNNGVGYGKGSFAFDAGIVDVNRLIVAQTYNITTRPVNSQGSQVNALHAEFNMEGGTLLADSIFIALNEDGDEVEGTNQLHDVNASSRGVMTVSGGDVTVTNDITVGSHTAVTPSTGPADATLNLTGGTVTVGGNLTEGSSGNNESQVLLDGATLDMTGGYVNVDNFDTQSGTLKNVQQIFDGAMAAADLVKTGVDKRLVLEGDNNYTGSTLVQQGNLQVGRLGDGNTGLGAVSVAQNATLSGSGMVRGDTIMASGSLLSPGDDGGTGTARLTFTGSLTLSLGSSALLELAGADYNVAADFAAALALDSGLTYQSWISTQGAFLDDFHGGNHDSIDVQDELVFDGTLNVSQVQNYQAGYGDVFNLVDWVTGGLTLNFGSEMQVAGGQFDELTLPDFGDSGLLWDLSLLNSHGILTVVPEPSRAFLGLVALLCLGLRRRRSVML